MNAKQLLLVQNLSEEQESRSGTGSKGEASVCKRFVLDTWGFLRDHIHSVNEHETKSSLVVCQHLKILS